MSNEINKDRKPTAIDRIILEWLKSGQTINHVTALNKFKTTMSRDSIWRLLKDGEPIQSRWHYYKTAEGKTKKFKEYFITEPQILPSGDKTEKGYKKGEKTFIDYANQIIEKAKNYGVEQTSLFPAYQECLKSR